MAVTLLIRVNFDFYFALIPLRKRENPKHFNPYDPCSKFNYDYCI
jgi:hypothetical protein